MQSPLAVIVLFSLLGVSIAGQRHAYENIAFFLGYRAELLLKPENKRIIGMKCAAADPITLKCLDGNPKYKSCKGSVTVKNGYGGEKIEKACNLREFLSHISGGKQHLKGEPLTGVAKNYNDKPVLGADNENALYIDVDTAVKKMDTMKAGFEPGQNWCKIMDGAMDYEGTATRFGDRILEMKNGRTPEEITRTEMLFQRMDEALTGLVTDRACELSAFLLPKLEGRFSPLVTETVSGNRQRFYEDKTVRAIEKAWKDEPDGENKAKQIVKEMKDVIEKHYTNKKAADHLGVNNLWEVYAPQQEIEGGCSPRAASS